MSKEMERYLDSLIEMGGADADGEGGIPIQVVFEPGAGQAVGGLRHALDPKTKKQIPGLFELCTAAKPGPDAPLEIRKLDFVVISQIFAASAVQRIVQQIGGEKPAPSIIIPH